MISMISGGVKRGMRRRHGNGQQGAGEAPNGVAITILSPIRRTQGDRGRINSGSGRWNHSIIRPMSSPGVVRGARRIEA